MGWEPPGGGSSPPNGTASGDLSATYPSPVVAQSSAAGGFVATTGIDIPSVATPAPNGLGMYCSGVGVLRFFSGVGPAIANNSYYSGSGGSFNTANSAVVTNPVPVSGTAFTPSATKDVMLYVPVAATTTGTVTITMGPTTGAENTIVPVSNLVTQSEPTFTLRVPGGWKVIVTITGTTVSIGTTTAVSG